MAAEDICQQLGGIGWDGMGWDALRGLVVVVGIVSNRILFVQLLTAIEVCLDGYRIVVRFFVG